MQYLKTKGGAMFYLITGADSFQCVGFHSGELNSQFTAMVERGNALAVNALKAQADLLPSDKSEFDKLLLTVLDAVVKLCKSHGVRTPGMDQVTEYCKAKLK